MRAILEPLELPRRLRSGPRFGHDGSNEGFQSLLVAYADSGSGVAMMSNSDSGFVLLALLAASVATEYGWASYKPRLTVHSPLLKADLLERLKGVEAALAWYKEQRRDGKAQGTSPNILNRMGYRLLSEGRVADAVKVLEANVELHPENANAHDSLGEGYLKAGRKEEAIASYRKALQLEPKNPHAAKELEKLGVSP